MADEVASRREGLAGLLVAHWPSLPHLAFGIWMAWCALAYSGSMWLSDTEVGGLNLSTLYILTMLGEAAVFFWAAWRSHIGEPLRVGDRTVLVGGAVASVGCLFVILIGPYYLGRFFPGNNPLFFPLSYVIGMGMGVVCLRCCRLYGSLAPRTVLLRSALSLALGSVVFFVFFACPGWAPIAGGPTWAGVVSLCGLPLLAALMANLPVSAAEAAPLGCGAAGVAGCAQTSAGRATSGERVPRTFWKLVAFSFIVSLAISMLRGPVVLTHPLATTVEGNNLLMLMRLVFALAFVAVGALGDAHHINLGRICSLTAIVSAVCVAGVSAFGVLATGWSVVVYFLSGAFEFVTWCMLAFLVKQKGLDALYVFGWGRGAFFAGSSIGWLLGVTAAPRIPEGDALSLFYLLVAGVMLVLSLLLFSEKDYDRLFSPNAAHEMPLSDLLELDPTVTPDPAARKAGNFGRAVKRIALTATLSEREGEAFRYLAMGYGTDRVASEMGVSVNTVRVHTHNVYVKLDVHSRRELMELVDREVAYGRRATPVAPAPTCPSACPASADASACPAASTRPAPIAGTRSAVGVCPASAPSSAQ